MTIQQLSQIWRVKAKCGNLIFGQTSVCLGSFFRSKMLGGGGGGGGGGRTAPPHPLNLQNRVIV